MINIVHPDTFLFHAQRTLRQTKLLKSETSYTRYAAIFGLSTEHTAILWYRLVEAHYTNSTYSLPSSASPNHLLWGLLFLKAYNTEHVNASVTGVDEKTFRKWAWVVVKAIGDLYNSMVSHSLLA